MCCVPAHVSAQTATGTVTVSQSFIDDANAAFREVVTLRAANTALIAANSALGEANANNAAAVKALSAANGTLKQDNADLRSLKCGVTSFFFGLLKNRRCK